VRRVLLAELEIWHSRPIAPTRRLALGEAHVPFEPAPGAGGVLLAGIVAAHVGALDEDERDELATLAGALERGLRIPQPQLRHRLQHDRVGLTSARHRLVRHGSDVRFELARAGAAPQQHVLGALYAAGGAPRRHRVAVFDAMRIALSWRGSIGPALIARLGGLAGAVTAGDEVRWALGVLDLHALADGASTIDGERTTWLRALEREVQGRYRELLRAAHPDHGADHEGAAARIDELREARRILLALT
jgi:hypothetical protein